MLRCGAASSMVTVTPVTSEDMAYITKTPLEVVVMISDLLAFRDICSFRTYDESFDPGMLEVPSP